MSEEPIQEEKKIWPYILISVLLTVILVVLLLLLLAKPACQQPGEPVGVQNEITDEVVVSIDDEDEFQEVTSNGEASIIVAQVNPDQDPAPGKYTGQDDVLVIEYFIQQMRDDGSFQDLGLIEGSFYNEAFDLYKDEVFFLEPGGTIGAVDITTTQRRTVNIPGIVVAQSLATGENSIWDFVIGDGKIFYLKGHCSENGYCALGEYDLETGENRIIADNLEETIVQGFFNIAYLTEYDDSNERIVMTNSGGDAGWGWISTFAFNPATGEYEKLSEVFFGPDEVCGDECIAWPELDENGVREDSITYACDEYTVQLGTRDGLYRDAYRIIDTVVISDSADIIIQEDAYYAGCHE